MKRILSVLIFPLILTGASGKNVQEESSEIYYVPIHSETYVPVTTTNIEELAVRHGYLEHKHVQRLLDIISSYANSGNFNRQYVRVKINLAGGKIIYLDNVGGVLCTEKERVLSRKALEKLRILIESNMVNDN